MFLSRTKAKGNYYIYLKSYSVRFNYAATSETVYKFGRAELALKRMYKWRDNFTDFPEELRLMGCGKSHIEQWIKYLETGTTKTGRQFKAII